MNRSRASARLLICKNPASAGFFFGPTNTAPPRSAKARASGWRVRTCPAKLGLESFIAR
jgi:hypothetical protein